MSRQKEMYLVIDTETANFVEEPLPYDIGYAITDRNGNIYLQRSFVVAEIFCDCPDLMATAYYAKKIPQYWQDIKSGKRVLKTTLNIRKQILADIKQFNVCKVGAYNMRFDRNALNNLVRWVTKSSIRWFFPYGTKYFCIWSMACQTFLNTVGFVKFAKANNYISYCGNIQTSAEVAYRFMHQDNKFSESHTGLEDVGIEIEIMVRCYKTHRKMDKSINPKCWMIPQAISA